MPIADGKRLREKIIEGAEKVEEDEMGQNEWEAVRLRRRLWFVVCTSLTMLLTDHAHRPRPIPCNERNFAERVQRPGPNRDHDVHSNCGKLNASISVFIANTCTPA